MVKTRGKHGLIRGVLQTSSLSQETDCSNRTYLISFLQITIYQPITSINLIYFSCNSRQRGRRQLRLLLRQLG